MKLLKKIRKYNQNDSGFSLVELLLYMGLSMILLVLISGIFISVLDIRNESIKTSSVERDGRYIMAKLSYDVYSAQDIIEPENIGDSSVELQLMINSQLVTYRVVDNQLQMIDSTGTHLMNGNAIDVSSFNLKKLGNEGGKAAVEVRLVVESTNRSRNDIETRSYKTLMTTR